MLIVHATRKLAQRLGGLAPAPARPTALPALGAWYATVMFWRPQVALFVSEATLLHVGWDRSRFKVGGTAGSTVRPRHPHRCGCQVRTEITSCKGFSIGRSGFEQEVEVGGVVSPSKREVPATWLRDVDGRRIDLARTGITWCGRDHDVTVQAAIDG